MKHKKMNKSNIAKSVSAVLGSTMLTMMLTNAVQAETAPSFNDKVNKIKKHPVFIDDSQDMQEFTGADLMDLVTPEDFFGDIRELELIEEWQPGNSVKSIPRRIYPNEINSIEHEIMNAVTDRGEHLMSRQTDAEGTYQRAVTDGDVNLGGIGYTGVNPADPTGTVGKNHYIQSVNGNDGAVFSIYDKATGNKVSGPTAMSSLGKNTCKTALGDPIVFYDEEASRYVMTEFSNEAGRSLCVYVSKTDNPVTGGWYAYEFQAPEFPDYPKFGRWGDSYFAGTNETAGPGIYALERSKLLTGEPARMQRKTLPKLSGIQFQMLMPVDVDTVAGPATNEPGLFIRQNDDELNNSGSNNASQDYIELWTFDPDYDNTANSKLVGPIKIAISEFDSNVCPKGTRGFGCLTQKGSTTKLDPVREVVMYRAQYRKFAAHETIVANFLHHVGSNRAGIRWFELRKVGTGEWALHQEGTYAPTGTDNRFMGSAAMDGSGNIALSYHIAGADTYPGINMTGRLATDAKGVMTQTEKVLIAGGSHIASERNGDYSHLSLDPVDQCTFWMTSDYGKANGQWDTHIANFKFAECGDSTATSDFTMQATNLTQQVCANTSLQPIAISTVASGGFDKAINLSYNGLPSGITGTFSTNPVAAGSSSNANVAVGGVASGTYNFNINGAATGVTAKQIAVALTVTDKPGSVALSLPASGATDVAIRPTFSWAADSTATAYRIEIATDNAFSTIVATGTVANGTNYQPSADLGVNTTYYWRVRADNGCGQAWSATSSFTTTGVVSASVLVKGIAKTVSGESGATTDYTFAVPAGASNLTFKMTGGTGDADLHVKFGEKATASTYDCRPYKSGNTEACTITNVQTGTYHVMLQGYQAYAGVSLTADYDTGTTTTPPTSDNVNITDLAGEAGSEDFYAISVPAGASKLTVKISGGTGDADLAIRLGSNPTDNNYKCRPNRTGNNETCTVRNPNAGEWHIGIFGYEDYAGLTLTAIVE